MQINPEQTAQLSAMREVVQRDILQHAFEESANPIFVLDADSGRFVAANPSGLAMAQRDMREIRKLRPDQLITRLSHARFRNFLGHVRQRSSQRVSFYCSADLDGLGTHRVRVNFLANGRASFVVIVQDASPMEAAQDQARRAESRLVDAIEALSDGFVYYDRDDRLVLCNQRYKDIYPESAPAMKIGASFESILRYGLDHQQYADGIGREEDWLSERLAARGPNNAVEQQLNDGRWLRIVERNTPDGGRVGLRVDITALKRQQEELARAARSDELTGLLNRRGLAEKLEALAETLRPDQRIAILHIDLDRFKGVNDVHGHEAGDFVLRFCARILRSEMLLPGVVARVGGDEFTVVLRTRRSDAAIRDHAMDLVSRLSRPVLYQAHNCVIGASAGIAFYDATMPREALRGALINADIALNHAKHRGEGSVAVFDPSMRHQTLRDNEMINDMQAGLGQGQFRPYFQPQIDTANNRIVGFEALIRWHHPRRGLVPANEFLELAQQSGLTEALDDIVIEHSCAAVRHLIENGFLNPHISVNLSMAQISDPTTIERFASHLRRFEIKPENLGIELLESTLLDDASALIIKNVHELIAAGYEVELDDFGTGHAAIATLRKFNVSRIKVDRSLVQNIDTDKELQVITAAIIDLAHRLGIKALAEGVETEFEQVKLTEMGCSCAQGYLHARPMPLEELVPWLTARGELGEIRA